ncbi:MAG: hypothetical protein NTY13_03395 [Chlamydiae bacterium]|nr:hypothetical protein [Chlamydiota bacterium]
MKYFLPSLVFFGVFFTTGTVYLEALDVYSQIMERASMHIAPILNQGLSSEEQSFYNQLSSDRKRAFLNFSKEDRIAAMEMTRKYPPKEALERAINYDMKTLPLTQQTFYNRLSDNGKKIFFILSEESSADAASLSETMPADDAIKNALYKYLSYLIPEQRTFYNSLDDSNKILYLSLSNRTQENLVFNKEALKDPNKAVLAAQNNDAARLYPNQKAFYDSLGLDDRIFFLSLTPDARGLAIFLTQGIDPNRALDYLIAIQNA